MNAPTQLHGNVLTSQGWIQGNMVFDQRIRAIDGRPLRREPRVIDEGDYILPGFIDLHVHGGGGRDVMEGGDAVQVLSRLHARHGTTSLLATTMTAPPEHIERALQGVRQSMAAAAPDAADIMGVHLEGPFLNSGKLGAQPPLASTGNIGQVQRWHGIAPIRVLTLAPEIPGHLELIPQLAAMGIRAQAGHSAGSYDDGVAAMRAGAAGFTHLFNGMSGMSHKEPGMVDVAMAHAEYAEIIPDLLHVHPGAMRAALRAIPRLYGVTDATSATGMPDGEYALGTQRVFKCMGCVRLATGSLAGSVLTMDQALRNFVGLGMEVAEASQRLSLFPADYLGESQRGRLAPGAWADIVVLDQSLHPVAVFVEGEAIPLT